MLLFWVVGMVLLSSQRSGVLVLWGADENGFRCRSVENLLDSKGALESRA